MQTRRKTQLLQLDPLLCANKKTPSTRSIAKRGVKTLQIEPIQLTNSFIQNSFDNAPPLAPLSPLSPPYPVDIDFDEASREWHANKKRVGHMYVYICGKTLVSGNKCQRTSGTNINGYCKQHDN